MDDDPVVCADDGGESQCSVYCTAARNGNGIKPKKGRP